MKEIENSAYIRCMIKTDTRLYNDIGTTKLEIEKTLFDGTFNKSFLFLLPLTGFDKAKYEEYFVNCYYDSTTKLMDIKNCLYILAENNEGVRNHLKSLEGYIYNYYAGVNNNKKYYMYCIQINNNDDDYDLITNSYYSHISDKVKNIYKNYSYFRNKKRNETYVATVEGVVHKRIWLKKQIKKKIDIDLETQEYWSNFDENLNKEIYKYGKEKESRS